MQVTHEQLQAAVHQAAEFKSVAADLGATMLEWIDLRERTAGMKPVNIAAHVESQAFKAGVTYLPLGDLVWMRLLSRLIHLAAFEPVS